MSEAQKEAMLAALGQSIEYIETELTRVSAVLTDLRTQLDELTAGLEAAAEEHDQRIANSEIERKAREEMRGLYDLQAESESDIRKSIEDTQQTMQLVMNAIESMRNTYENFKTQRKKLLNKDSS